MILDIEFDSVTRPSSRVKKTYDIPPTQNGLIKSIKEFFDASEHGMLIIPVKLTIMEGDMIKEIDAFVSTSSGNTKCKRTINPRSEVINIVKPIEFKKSFNLKGRFIAWLIQKWM